MYYLLRFLAYSSLSIIFFSCSNNQKEVSDISDSLYTNNKAPLLENKYMSLPLGSIKAKGWLKSQLEIQAKGLTGHLDEYYPEVVGQRNGWLGGDGDGWERGPYWIDGLLPLAHILDDEKLKQKSQPWIEWALNSQTEDGYFGPIPFKEKPAHEEGIQRDMRKDWWPKMVMLKIFQQYYSATKDERVIDVMTKYFHYQLRELKKTPLDHYTFWANRSGGDNMMSVYWLYNITEDKSLLELGELLNKQTFPWTTVFLNKDYDLNAENAEPWSYFEVRYPFDSVQISKLNLRQKGHFHTVNVSQGIKQPLVYSQAHNNPKYLEGVKKAFFDLKKYHGQAQGMFGGDEPLHGADPTQGVELCSIVELMYSLEVMTEISGDLDFAEHLERIAFNALPTQATDDYMERQYFQSANQIRVSQEIRNFYQSDDHKGTNNVFGLTTGYPCCTTNMHQGWPKFVQNLWYATNDNGVATLMYSPSEVKIKVADGQEVTITEDTRYPFNGNVKFTVKTDKEVEFPFEFRIPTWTKEAKVLINGKVEKENLLAGLSSVKRIWKNGDVMELVFPMEITNSRWFEFTATVERGPLVYALKIEEDWKDVETNGKYNSWKEVHPKSDWNFALIEGDLKNMKNHFKIQENTWNESNPWSIENAPLQINGYGAIVKDWEENRGMPLPLPYSPRPIEKEIKPIELIPYGCTTLRITEFPVVR